MTDRLILRDATLLVMDRLMDGFAWKVQQLQPQLVARHVGMESDWVKKHATMGMRQMEKDADLTVWERFLVMIVDL